MTAIWYTIQINISECLFAFLSLLHTASSLLWGDSKSIPNLISNSIWICILSVNILNNSNVCYVLLFAFIYHFIHWMLVLEMQNGNRHKSAVVQVNNASNHQQRSEARLRNVILHLVPTFSVFYFYFCFFICVYLSLWLVFPYWFRYKCVAKNPRGETDGTIRLYCK